MKVRCINNRNCEKLLTVGKTYDVISITNDYIYYHIINGNVDDCYCKSRFKSLSKSELRNEKIERLLR